MNEISIPFITGATVTVRMYSGTTPQGSPIAMTELGTTGVYVGSVPNGTPYGQYSLVGLSGGNTIGSGQIYWGGTAEINMETAAIEGLDPNNPMTAQPTLRKSGSVNLGVNGYGTNLTTVQRF